ncbi:uncharacterized protein BX664DRAFT_295992 [Halteromyces radiatus]|uniref:uncharacterized protein n=1 Tax=Halteromyces radiatus TaxID=101107 RepID=UPI002220CA49|nr:uncharacterized protein BX664DRAFT_295992 [Halteromyces radiatus]KAI8088699.1 hypothetical protein BX664DRAFT_295992 [Halteromyces radiatus]
MASNNDISIDLKSVTYVDNVNSNLVCCICQYPFVNPLVSPCGHTFCETCIYQALDSCSQCPIDRSPLCLPDLEPAVKIIVNMVNELLIYCPRKERGCDFIGQRQYMEHHMNNDCLYVFQSCQLQECQELILKKDLHSHVSTCKYRETVCKMCKKKMPAFELEDHYKLCPSEIIQCPHCDSSRSRSEHATHLTTCPKVPMTCTHAEFGCPWTGERATMEEHTTSCTYEAIKDYLHQQQQKYTQMKEELQAVRKENESLKQQQWESRQKLETMTNQLGILFPAHFSIDPDLPLDTQQEVVLSETQRLQNDIDTLSANMTNLELKQNMALMTETFRLQEELQSVRAICHGMRMQMHYLMMERRGAMMMQATSGTTNTHSDPPPPPPPLPPHDQDATGSTFQRMRSWLDPSGSRQDTKL